MLDPYSTHLLGNVHPTVRAVVEDLLEFAKNNGLTQIRAWQGYNSESRPEHSSGLAVDMGHNGTFGAGWSNDEGRRQIAILDQYIINKYGPYLKWLLSEQRAWNPVRNGWRDMENRGSTSANHRDHAHLFFDANKINQVASIVGTSVSVTTSTGTGSVPEKPGRLSEDEALGDATLNGLRWLVGAEEVRRGAVYRNMAWRKLPTNVFETSFVRKIQEFLGIKVDGLAWGNTIQAMQNEFKKNYRCSIKTDGVWGPKTTFACQQYINWQTGNN